MSQYFPINPAAPAAMTVPLMEPLCSSRDLDIEAFHNSRYWQTLLRGPRLLRLSCHRPHAECPQLSSWGVLGEKSEEPLTTRTWNWLACSRPTSAAAVGITDMLSYQRVDGHARCGQSLDALCRQQP